MHLAEQKNPHLLAWFWPGSCNMSEVTALQWHTASNWAQPSCEICSRSSLSGSAHENGLLLLRGFCFTENSVCCPFMCQNGTGSQPFLSLPPALQVTKHLTEISLSSEAQPKEDSESVSRGSQPFRSVKSGIKPFLPLILSVSQFIWLNSPPKKKVQGRWASCQISVILRDKGSKVSVWNNADFVYVTLSKNTEKGGRKKSIFLLWKIGCLLHLGFSTYSSKAFKCNDSIPLRFLNQVEEGIGKTNGS